jgi:hypothetical protein
MLVLNMDEVKLTKREEKSLTDIMSNLPKMNEALKDDDLFDLEMVRKALALELRTKRRPATVGRLAGRFKTMVGHAIDREIYGMGVK